MLSLRGRSCLVDVGFEALARQRGGVEAVAGPCSVSGGYSDLLLKASPPGRLHHTSACCSAKSLLHRMLLKSKKKIWYQTPPQTWATSQGSALRPPKRLDEEDSRRCRILNPLLFKAISDLVTSPQISDKLDNCTPDITKVRLSPDFSSCRVFWCSTGDSERDRLIQNQLDRNAPSIRYQIMSQQIMGGVPPLVFLRDKQQAAVVEVDRLLQQADFGPDYPPDTADDRPVSMPISGGSGSALFGVDHEALNQQIAEWRQRSKTEGLVQTPPPQLSQEQLSVMTQFRKQQIIKKRKKAAPPIDDDITLREFLLACHDDITPQGRSQVEGTEEGGAFKQEEDQLQELMSQEDRKL